MFGVEQTGKVHHMDKESYQSLKSSTEYQSFIAANPDAVKLSGNGNNIIVIIDQNEF